MVVCYYCRKSGHVIQGCKKLQYRNQRVLFAHIASFTEAFDQSVEFSADKLTRFHLYQKSLQSPSTPDSAIAESGNPNTCLVSSSSSEWVIDFGATYHMTSNSSLFSTFSHNLHLPLSLWHMGHSPVFLVQAPFFPLLLFPYHPSRVYLIFLLIWYL